MAPIAVLPEGVGWEGLFVFLESQATHRPPPLPC